MLRQPPETGIARHWRDDEAMNGLPKELQERLDYFAALHGMDPNQAIEHLLRAALNLAIPDPKNTPKSPPIAQQIGKADGNTANLLARRNGSKLNKLVQQRHNPEAWAEDGGADTNVDLLVDRLHDIAESPEQNHQNP
ncbi:MAG: Uncharacterised protein [Prochlorococcus marinus str. MIT 9215]|nr:MAG: Uncharacterised protein [Prochlorococcus marinus str. MIT 9215]